jgi:hypothetical protein
MNQARLRGAAQTLFVKLFFKCGVMRDGQLGALRIDVTPERMLKCGHSRKLPSAPIQ